MQPRVAYVSPIIPGSEGDVREAHTRFPEQVLNQIGAQGSGVFIGSGYYVMVFDFPSRDFQTRFAEFTGHPAVQAFFDELEPYLLEPLPRSVRPSDAFRGARRPGEYHSVGAARLPLAGEVFSWQAAIH